MPVTPPLVTRLISVVTSICDSGSQAELTYYSSLPDRKFTQHNAKLPNAIAEKTSIGKIDVGINKKY